MNTSKNIIQDAGTKLEARRSASSENARRDYCQMLDRLAAGDTQDDDAATLANLMGSLGIDQAEAAADLKLVKARRSHARNLESQRAQAQQIGNMADLQAQLVALDAKLKEKIGALLKPKVELIRKIDDLYAVADQIDRDERNPPKSTFTQDQQQAYRLALLFTE